jgi:glycosyltransferase involved in cell wall biosynthesis
MRVLMLAPEPFLEPRGTPLSVYQRLRALSVLGHEVDLVTYHVGQPVELPSLRVHRIPAVPFIKEVPVGPSWIKPLLDILLLAVAFLLLLRRRFDVIHSHEEAAFIAVFLSFFFRTRHIYDMHSSLPRQFSNFGLGNWRFLVGWFKLLERMVMNTCDAVITVGSDLEALVRRINPLVPVITIENMPPAAGDLGHAAVTLDELRQRLALQDFVSIVYTGTFEAYQGLDLLLESARIVVNSNPKAHFLLVGGKTHQIARWRDVVDQTGLADHVQFVGMVPIEEAVLYLELADMLVSPRTGGTSVPLKIYSYLHAGKPMVATRVIAHTTVLNDRIACLVEPTKEAFAEGILALLGDVQLRTRLGDAARSFAEEKYSFLAYTEKVRLIYQTQARSSRKIAGSRAVIGD